MTRATLLLLASLVTTSCHLGSWNRIDLGETSTEASLGTATTLEVLTSVGDVEILPSLDGRVHVLARVQVREDHEAAQTVADAMRDVRVTETADGRLLVEDGHRGDPDEDSWSVSLVVQTPDVARVIVRTDVGDIDVVGIAASVEARSDVGDIHVQGATGVVDLHTDVGDLVLSAGLLTEAKLVTAVGDVEVRLDQQFLGSLQLSTDVGDLSLPAALQGRWNRDVVSESFRRETDHASLLQVRTDVGDIRVIDASTGSQPN